MKSKLKSQMLLKRIDAGLDRPRLSVNCNDGQATKALPIGQKSNQCARSQLVGDFPSTNPDDSTPGECGFAKRFSVGYQLRSEFDFFALAWLYELPLILDVPLQCQQCRASVLTKIGRHVRNARALEICGRCGRHHG